ncbi:MAG: protein phosphatase CheZ [Janthinobacterium lividum]
MHEVSDLPKRLLELGRRYPDAKSEVVAEVVVSILSSMSGDLSSREAALLHEIGSLGQAVATTRLEIAALGVDDITVSYIPCANDELDAIVAHTASATESILEVCETLDALGSAMDGAAARQLQDATMKIYEACSFQDITGQRITKVVHTLKTIETTIARIVQTFGVTPGILEPVARAPDVTLLNGPQLPAAAMDQSDIDALLASFD